MRKKKLYNNFVPGASKSSPTANIQIINGETGRPIRW